MGDAVDPAAVWSGVGASVAIREQPLSATGQAGWGFERVGEPERVLLANVRWLSRYRHPRCLNSPIADRLREVFAVPSPLMAGGEAVGDRLATLPALFHLLWLQELTAEEMTVELLGPSAIVRLASGCVR